MIDIRPIVYVLGRILTVFAVLMLAPAFIDYRAGLANRLDFLQSAILTGSIGALLALSTQNALGSGLGRRQAYLLLVTIWCFVPVFAALPFYIGAPGLSLTDAYFEAVSGITATGASVIHDLDGLPDGTNLWRGLLNWLGGFGIVVVAMIFLPLMRVGGMQFFRSERYENVAMTMPRLTDITRQLLLAYFGITVLAMIGFALVGMTAIEAAVHALSGVSTGGFSTTDESFSKFAGAGEYVMLVVMLVGSLPFIRYVQMLNGAPASLWQDVQVRGFFAIAATAVLIVTLWRLATSDIGIEQALRHTTFNLVSIMTGAGFSSGAFLDAGGFVMIVAFMLGLVGGCSGSSTGALSVFRVQVVVSALVAQVRLIVNPNRISPVKYGGRRVESDVIGSLMLFVTGFVLSLGLLTVTLSLMGVDLVSALFGVWATLGNIGYGYGPMVGETGKFDAFPTEAKWVLILAMLMGRLGLLAALVLFLPRFWRS